MRQLTMDSMPFVFQSMSDMFWICLICSLVYFSTVDSQLVECSKAFECVGQSIVSGGILSRGYKSTYSSATSVDHSGTGIWSGGLTGYQIGSIFSRHATDSQGAGALMESTITATDSNSIYVSSSGAGGLANSDITFSNYVYCTGTMACYNVKINGYGNIEVQGSLGLQNGLVTSNGGDITMTLYGYYAGYNSVITCNSGDTCTINCYGNACFGLQMNCLTGSNCIINCDDSNNIICPITYGVDPLPSIPSSKSNYVIDVVTQILTNDNNCNNNGFGTAVNFDDHTHVFSEYNLGSVSNNNGNICCRGDYSCAWLDDITIGNNYDIICSASYSCEGQGSGPQFYFDNISSINSNVYCNARDSCDHVDMYLPNNHNGSIVCGAQWACFGTYVYKGKNLYCSGGSGCSAAKIYGTENIYVTGNDGAIAATINTDGTPIINVYFDGYNSGRWTVVNCEKGDFCNVYCQTNGACSETTVNAYCNNYYIECDAANGIDCPTLNVDTSSCEPTSLPTEMPTPFSCPNTCDSDPCDCDEVEDGCDIYKFGIGCQSCQSNYFRINSNYNYPCIHCQNTFGNQCLNCQDSQGCSQCDNGYTLTYDNDCGLWYCELDNNNNNNNNTTNIDMCPQACNSNNTPCDCSQVTNCQVCNVGSGCSQCLSGYFKVNNNYDCMDCQSYAGIGCLFCQDFNGCGQCQSGYTMVTDSCGLKVCQ